MMLGDNITDRDFSKEIAGFKSGGMVFAKEVPDPERFGVVTFDDKFNVLTIEEKPIKPKSNYAIFGLYVFDSRVVQYANELKPSARGEIEIVDLHNRYLKNSELKVNILSNDALWEDAGTFDSLLRVSNIMAEKYKASQK